MRFPETSKRRSRPAAIAISSPRRRLSPSPPLPGLDASWLAAVRGCAYRSRATRLVSLERRHNRNGPARVRPNRWAGRGGNRLLERSAIRVFTADHPPSHASLSANQPGTTPFDQGVVGWIMQTLWPVHCVQGSHGAAFHHRLASKLADLILRNGIRPELDSYSAFYENDRQTSTLMLWQSLALRLITALPGHPRTPCTWVTARVYFWLAAAPLTVGDRWSALSPRCARSV
jgi:hypothetical protein